MIIAIVKRNIQNMISSKITRAVSKSVKFPLGNVCCTPAKACNQRPVLLQQKPIHLQADFHQHPRRKSLTLATIWGDVFNATTLSPQMNVAQTSKNILRKSFQLSRPQLLKSSVKETSAADATAERKQASKCPFHAMLGGNKRRHSVHAFSKPSFTRQQRRRHSVSATASINQQQQAIITIEQIAERINARIDENMRKLRTTLTASIRYLFNDESIGRTTQKYSSIPGPKGLPFLGSVLDYTFLGKFSPSRFNEALEARHSTFGKIFREKFLNEEFVYVSDPKDLQVLAQNEGATPYRPSLDCIVQSREEEGLDVGITAMQGEEWYRLRKAINKVIMKPGSVTNFRPAQHDVTKDFIEFMKHNRDGQTKEIDDFQVWLNRWALESIAVILLDTRLGLIKKDKNDATDPMAERLRKGMDVFFDYGAKLAFNAPTWKIWNTKDWKIYRQCQKDEFEAAGSYVDRKLAELKDQESRGMEIQKDAKSFLEYLVKDSNLERDESLTLCLELLAGGIDTTANAVVFTLYELARNPQQQGELRELIKEDCDVDENTMKQNKSKSARYLRGCVWESLRLHPLTYVNMRKTNKDLVLSGYEVPSGTTVRYTNHLTQLKNEKYFKDAEKFIPERWTDRKSDYRCKQQFVFTPFGHGARQCPGRRIAEQELDLLLRDLIKNFKVTYNHEDIGTKVRLFNAPDKPAKFSFEKL